MTVDIFIRTYHKDIEWLKYCLRSIVKFTTGFRQTIICIPENQKNSLAPLNLTIEKVVTCPVYRNDYIGQQISKLRAWEHTDADLILFVDSDMCFTGPATPETFMRKGKPLLFCTPYEEVGDAICWKEPTEKYVGQPVDYEYMRTLPLMYWRPTVQDAYWHIQEREQEILGGDSFSEFNLLGALAAMQEPAQYAITDTKDGVPDYPRKQAWSWGGLTPEIRTELNKLLEVKY